MRRKWWILIVAPLAMAVFIAIGGAVVRLLWNWLAPALFGLREVTFWQAVGLLALCRILFGGFGRGGGAYRSLSRRRMARRWDRMTPEERERFRQGLHARSERVPPPGASPIL